MLVMSGRTANNQLHGFKRMFFATRLPLLYATNKLNSLTRISGIRNNQIYFDTDTPGVIAEADVTLSKINTVHLSIPLSKNTASLFQSSVIADYYYIMAGNVPEVTKVSLRNDSAISLFLQPYLFTISVPISTNAGIIRAYKKIAGKLNQVFMKWSFTDKTLVSECHISDTTNDAGFSTDGNLLYDSRTHKILYVEYYSNQILCMDTALHLTQKAYTIDTFHSSTIKAIRTSQSITNGSPLKEVNLESATSDGKLYIHSAIKADNESVKSFSEQADVDVYNISNGTYISSVQVPVNRQHYIMDFTVYQNKLIVLFTDTIIIYSLPKL